MSKIIFTHLQILLEKCYSKYLYLNLDSHKIYLCLNTSPYNGKLRKKLF